MRRLIRRAALLLLAAPLAGAGAAVGTVGHATAATCSPPVGTPNFTTLTGVSFSGSSNGIAVGARNIAGHQPAAYQTTDGTDWTPLTPTCADSSLAAVSTPDSAHAWIAGAYYNSQTNATTPLILSSSDGGANWTAQSPPAGVESLTGIHFLDANTGWAAGMAPGGGAAVIHTTDGGATWSALPAPSGLVGLDGLAVVDSTHVNVVGYAHSGSTWQPEIAVSSDGGASWTEHALGGPAASNVGMSISFVNAIDGWVTGLNDHEAFIGHTIDGGVTWSFAPDAPFARYHGVSFADPGHGWVVGTAADGSPSILASTDGGGELGRPNAAPARKLRRGRRPVTAARRRGRLPRSLL